MSKGKKGSTEKKDSPYVVKKPPFAGRYFVSDQIGDWVPTDELKAV